jgi:hypothetical protein
MTALEKQIAAWREAMTRATGNRPSLVFELEVHLRDEIARLIEMQIPEDKLFETALAKLGSPSELAAEYAKLNPISRAWLPVRIARIAAVAAAVVAAALLARKLADGRISILLTVHIWTVTIGYLSMFLIGGLGICYVCARWFSDPGPGRREALLSATFQFAGVALVLTAIGIGLGAVWAKENLGRYWAWDPKETGGMLVLGWAALMSAARWLKPSQKPVMISMALVGNMITAWAWFGANAMAQGLSPHTLLNIFIGGHAVLIVVSLVWPMQRSTRRRVG